MRFNVPVLLLIVAVLLLWTMLSAQAEIVSLRACLPVPPVIGQAPAGGNALDAVAAMFANADVRTAGIYSFKTGKTALALDASFPVHQFTSNVSANLNALLISTDTVDFGAGAGVTCKNLISIFDLSVGWTTQTKWCMVFGINKIPLK